MGAAPEVRARFFFLAKSIDNTLEAKKEKKKKILYLYNNNKGKL